MPLLLDGLAAGLLPVVTATPKFSDALSSLASVLGKALVNRLRVPLHRTLRTCVPACSVRTDAVPPSSSSQV